MAEEDPRAALAAEAERLKAQRLGKQDQEAAGLAARKAAHDRTLTSVTAASLRKALSRPAFFWLSTAAMALAALALFTPIDTSDSEAVDPVHARTFGLVAALLGSIGILHHYSAIARARAWLKRLPFEVHGFDETLGYGMAHRRVELSLSFKDTAASTDVLRELVAARLGEHSSVVGITLCRTDLSVESANFPAAAWFRQAVKHVLLDVHRAHPLASVHFRGLEHTEFYYGSGD